MYQIDLSEGLDKNMWSKLWFDLIWISSNLKKLIFSEIYVSSSSVVDTPPSCLYRTSWRSIILGPYPAGGPSRLYSNFQGSLDIWKFRESWGWAGLLQRKYFYKLSTYLSAGLPVVVPDYLSNADYIREKGIGFGLQSQKEANRLVQDCTETILNVQKAQHTSYLFCGYFTKEIICW